MGTNSTCAQDYESMWRKIDELVIEDKPRSIIEEAEKILAKAKKENDFPQMLKAQMCITEKRCDLAPELFMPDEYEKLLTNIDNDTRLSASDKTGRLAVLHSMLASAYVQMQDSYVHDFDQETRELFPARAKEHFFAALDDMETLSHIDNTIYKSLIIQRKDSRFFNHDLLKVLLDFIFHENRHIFSEEEIISTYEKAIGVYESNGNRNAATLLQLAVLNIRHESSVKAILLKDKDYILRLEELHRQTQDIETGADVDVALAELYQNDRDKQLAFVRQAQIKWQDSKLLNHFKNTESEILSTCIELELPQNILAGKTFPLTIKQTNAKYVNLSIHEYAGKDKDGNLSESGRRLGSRKYVFDNDESNRRRIEARLPYSSEAGDTITLPAGRYTFVAETDGDRKKKELCITSLRITSLILPSDKNTLVTVFDNETGRPVPGATVMSMNGWGTNEKVIARFVTDNNGECIVPYFNKDKSSNSRLIAVRDASKYGTPYEDCTTALFIYPPSTHKEEKERTRSHIFTDRSIYRPGQTVHLSVIRYHQNGDDVKVLPDSEVDIRISNPDHQTIHTVKVTTNALGSASLEYALPTDCKLGNYSIYIEGERYGSSQSFHVEEYKRPTFDVKFDDDKNTTKYSLGDTAIVAGQARTFTDVPIRNAKVEYTIEWSESHRYWRWRERWTNLTEGETTTSDSGDIIIQFPTDIPMEVTSDSIAYRIKADVTDINGEMQHGEYTFKVKNPNYVERQREEDDPKDEIHLSTNEISESQSAIVTFKAKEKDALVYYYIVSNDKIEERGSKVLDGKEMTFTVRYRKEWGDGVHVFVQYVRNGHCFQTSEELVYVRPKKKVNLYWSTFRDNLIPGQQEEWVLNVKDKDGKAVSGAELLAVMYDASLDEIMPHKWNFELYFPRTLNYASIGTNHNSYGWGIILEPRYKMLSIHPRFYDLMQQFEHQRWYKREEKMMVLYSKAANVADTGMVLRESPVVEMSESAAMDMADATNGTSGAKQGNMRTNLSELAFFYPHLTTDNNGEAHIAFTLPDCLTEWRFMGMVHTPNMDYGSITAKATAKKDFMVQPNMPRFLRTGDKAVISAKIINMSTKDVDGTATLRILNAEDESVVMTADVRFHVPASQDTAVSFPIKDDIKEGDYICEITASDGNTSDGERNRLPILSTKVDVVENVPFYLDGASTKNIDLSGLFNQHSTSATDKAISIGYTDNPALSVFKSLRAMQNPEHDNAPCFAASLYSNLVMLDMSKVLDGYLDDFDAKASQAAADKALDKLKRLQLSDGSWSWFEGMSGSKYITLAVAENLSRLMSYFNRHHSSNVPSDIRKMLNKALKYLDRKTLEEYNSRKRLKLQLHPSDDDLRYLYIATSPDKDMLNTYLKELCKDFKNLTIFGRSQGVLILKKYGRHPYARTFLDSVKEYTVYKEGLGRYFATDIAYYSWMDYRIPTHLAAMRAIMDENENEQFILDMQLWLLRQKQTQTWDNPLNALDIADLLLTNDRETSLHEPTTPVLVLDGKSVEQDSVYSVSNADVLSVTKTSPGISWGHVRSTFKEEVSNLKAYSSGELTIERKVIRNGNKVTIRHILHADRDMDFVAVKSQHAANLEPLRAVSGYQWMGGRGCYLEVHDSYISLFFNKFTRGTTTIDMEYYIAREGEYNGGYASIECSYAPEFGAHTSGEK